MLSSANAASASGNQSDATSPFLLPAVVAVIVVIAVVVAIVFVRRRWDIKLSRSPE
jgi:Tfp pilus assembly protein PilN